MSAPYPVWVGSLPPSATEVDLVNAFSGCGSVDSVKIMKDGKGKSRQFGYMNYKREDDAERAARFGALVLIQGRSILAKGPKELEKEGHYKRKTAVSSAGKDYRPLTDCLFFMEKGGCKSRDKCPYRHNEAARRTQSVCEKWTNRNCSKENCPLQHPGTKSATGEKSVEKKPKSARAARRGKRSGKKVVMGGSSHSPDGGTDDTGNSVLGEGLSQSSGSYLDGSNVSSEGEAEEEEELSGFEGDEETSLYSSHFSNDSTLASDTMEQQNGSRKKSSEEALLSVSEAEMKAAMFLGSSDSEGSSEEEDLGESVSRLDCSWGRKKRLSSGSSANGSHKKPAGIGVELKVAKRQKVQQLDISSPSGEGLDVQTMLRPTESEPVGVFWDIENCSIPPGKSPFAVAQKIRKEFFEKKREAEFICVCDTMKENATVTDDLNNAQVTVVHVSAVAKNAADDKLRNAMRKFAHNFSPPATVVLISGDINFAGELSDLRDRHSFNIVLVHNAWTNDQLKAFARKTYLWEEFVEDVEERKDKKSSLPTEVVVKGLPSHISRYNLRERLSMLAGNCGGKVMEVHTTSAVVKFATPELAVRAQKRMDRQDAFGSTITAELRTLQGAPAPVRAPSNTRPPPPLVALSPPLAAAHPPPSVQPPPLPYLDNPIPSMPLTHQGRVVVENLSVDGPIEDVQTLKRVKGNLVQMALGAVPPIMIHPDVFLLWDGLHKLSAILALDVQGTAQARGDWTLVNTPALAASYARLTADLRAVGSQSSLEVTPLNNEQELQRRITRSHIIHIMTKYEFGWAKFKHFRGHFQAAFDQPCPEVDLKNAAKDVVDLIGAPHKQVVIFAAYNPAVKVKRQPSLERRIPRLLDQVAMIPLLNLPFQYERNFGPLPYAKDGIELFLVLESLPVRVETTDPSNIHKTVLRKAQKPARPLPQTEPDGPSLATKREIFLRECVPVLEQAGGSLPVKKLQPDYQTLYKRSPRASDYGVETLKELFRTSPLFKMSPDERMISLASVHPSPGASKPQLQKSPMEKAPRKRPTLDQLFSMCVQLLKENGGVVAVNAMQQKIQTKFHVSARLVDYGAPSMKELIMQCPGISINGGNYCLAPAGPPKAATSTVETTVDSLDRVKRNIMNVLVSEPDGRVALQDLGTAYQQCNKQALELSRLSHNVTTVAELVRLCKPELEIVDDQKDAIIQFSDSWLAQQRERFAATAKALLTQREGHCLPYEAFVGEYHRFTGKQLVLVEFGCKTLSGIFQKISSVVRIEKVQQGDAAPGRVIFLADENKPELLQESQQPDKGTPTEENGDLCLLLRRDLERLLYSISGHVLALNKIKPHFQQVVKKDLDYQKAGFAKLILFLESLTKSVVITGEGPARPVSLHPMALLAMNMVKLLSQHPAGLEMSEVVPRYAQQFEFIVVKNYGHKKLQTLLESEMGDLVEVCGYSPVRRVFLKDQAAVAAALNPSVATTLVEPLPLELAYLLFTSEGNQQGCTALKADYLNCYGKKLAILATHYKCSVPDLIRKNTPLEVEGNDEQAVVRLTPSQVFACQTAEVMSLTKEDLRLPPFVAAFESHFGFSPKPEMYKCSSFEQMLTSAQQFMQCQLTMKEGESFVTPSTFSDIFVKLDKMRKAERNKQTAPATEASSQESRESDNEEREASHPWPSFDTSESTTTDGAAMQWPELGSPPLQSNGEDEPLSGEEGEVERSPRPVNSTADEQILMPELELPVAANLVELPQKGDSHIPGEVDPPTGPLPGSNYLPERPLPSQAAANIHGNQTPSPAAPPVKKPTSRQKKGVKIAINFSPSQASSATGMQPGGVASMQPVGVAGTQPGGVAGMQPVGVAGMQPGGVAGMQPVGVARAQLGNSTTSTIVAMPPLQDCGDSDSQ